MSDLYSNIYNNIPAPVRHGLAIFIGTFLGIFFTAIIANGGVTTLDFGSTFVSAIDDAVVSAVGSLLVLYVTPLTKSYGIGKEEIQ